MSQTLNAVERIVGSATCLGCGCACDDINVVVRGERIVEARNACAMGAAWFGDGSVPARARTGGRDASVEDALDVAARLLIAATRPLVYLAPDISCETQREGVALADGLRAAFDTVTSATALGSVLAAQERGRAGATLGEIRNRADVVVFWGVDPMLRYPRYWSRYAPEPAGLYVPAGRRSRHVVAVDVDDARGPSDADLRVSVSARDEVAALTALAARVAAHERHHALATKATKITTDLATALLAGRYVAIVADAERAPGQDPGRAAALLALAQALNGPTRCALSMLRSGGNRSGADAVASWQTGSPAAVDFARGSPRYRPFDGSAGARLERADVDAILVVGSVALIPPELAASIATVPCAVVGPRASESVLAARQAVIDTGVAGIHEGGTVLRMDDVPLPLRPSLGGPPGATAVVQSLRRRIAAGDPAA